MSKIGRVNLELTEQANELGYDTVQEAIADGWEANEVAATLTCTDTYKELEQAHETWLKEKEKLLKNLDKVAEYFEAMGYPNDYIPTQHGKVIRNAIDFIDRGEV